MPARLWASLGAQRRRRDEGPVPDLRREDQDEGLARSVCVRPVCVPVPGK